MVFGYAFWKTDVSFERFTTEEEIMELADESIAGQVGYEGETEGGYDIGVVI